MRTIRRIWAAVVTAIILTLASVILGAGPAAAADNCFYDEWDGWVCFPTCQDGMYCGT
jgi:hypothetical protein